MNSLLLLALLSCISCSLCLTGIRNNVINSPLSRGPRQHSESSLKAYEVISAIDAGFATQLAGCGAVVFAGNSLVGAPLDVPITEAMSNDVKIEPLITEKPVDIYRDTPLRYAGYLNEIGEAFRPIVSGNIVLLSYVLAITYVLADAFSKGGECADNPKNQGCKGCGIAAVIDTLSFQFLASIIFPGTIINRWVTLWGYLVYKQFDVINWVDTTYGVTHDQVLTSLNGIDITADSIATTIPTVMGLVLIPLVVQPLDSLTEKILDEVVRPILCNTFPDCELPFAENDANAFGREA